MLRFVPLVCLSLLFWLNTAAQDVFNPEAMTIELDTVSDDKRRLQIYCELIDYYSHNDLEKVLELAEIALPLSEAQNDSETRSLIVYCKGVASYNAGKYPLALEYYNEALLLCRQQGLKNQEQRILNNKGIIFTELTAHENALENFLLALKINEETGDKLNIARTQANIGNLHCSMRNYDEALKAFNQTLKFFQEEGLSREIAITLNNLGEILKLQGDFDKALDCHLKALEIRNELGNNRTIAQTLANTASVYNMKEDYQTSLLYLEKALELTDSVYDKPTLIGIYGYMSEALLGMKQYEKAATNLNKGLRLCQELNMRIRMVQFYITFARLYEILGEDQMALECYKLVLNHRDTIYSNETNRRIAEMRTIYETEKKEQENQILLSENAIQRLTIQKNKTINQAILLILTLFIGLSIFAWRALRNKRKALLKEKELSQLQTQFISTVSHELKTPLAGILSSAQLLEFFNQAWNDEERKDYFKKIYLSVNHLKSLLDEVTLLGKTESYSLKYSPSGFDLHEEFHSVIEETKALIGDDIEVEFSSSEENHFVFADKGLVRHILFNILSNALKYSAKGGKVFVSLYLTENKISFSVKDQGIGIPPGNLPHIFEKFTRASNVGHIEGTGLGLSIVKHMVELHKGTIKVESELNKGTTVYVEIQAEKPPAKMNPDQ